MGDMALAKVELMQRHLEPLREEMIQAARFDEAALLRDVKLALDEAWDMRLALLSIWKALSTTKAEGEDLGPQLSAIVLRGLRGRREDAPTKDRT